MFTNPVPLAWLANGSYMSTQYGPVANIPRLACLGSLVLRKVDLLIECKVVVKELLKHRFLLSSDLLLFEKPFLCEGGPEIERLGHLCVGGGSLHVRQSVVISGGARN